MTPPKRLTRRQADDLLQQTLDRGFDASYLVPRNNVKVKCSQCSAVVINGTACHEQGCPNVRRREVQDEDE